MRKHTPTFRAVPFVALGAMLSLTSLAGADVIAARFDEVNPQRTVSISSDSGSSYRDILAGSFIWTRTGGDYAGPGANGTFITYCIELSQYISFGSTYEYTTRQADLSPVPGAGMGQARADLLCELFGRHYASQFQNADEAAAFQLAVWEVTHDDGLDLSDGTFRVDGGGSLSATAQIWLDSIDGTGPRLQLLAMTSESLQDQLFVVPNASTAALLCLGGAFGCLSRRRRNR